MIAKNLTILALGLLLAGCKYSPEERAIALINSLLSPATVTLTFGTLDSCFSTLCDKPEYADAVSRCQTFYQLSHEFLEVAEKHSANAEVYSNAMSYYGQMIDSSEHYSRIIIDLRRRFTSEHIGWTMAHTHRTNSITDTLIYTTLYYFDVAVKNVTKTMPVKPQL